MMNSGTSAIERSNFSHRLQASLAAANIPLSYSGVAREFNLRSEGDTVTTHGARKWLVGEAIPTQSKLNVLAVWLNVSSQWLRFGETPPSQESAASHFAGIPHHEVILLGDFRRLDEPSKSVVRDLISSLLKHCSTR